MHYKSFIASGSDEEELKYICASHEINNYFTSINGSPKHKNLIVQELKSEFTFSRRDTILVGDSMNDFEAAQLNDIEFFGYNNDYLKDIGLNYLQSLCQLER